MSISISIICHTCVSWIWWDGILFQNKAAIITVVLICSTAFKWFRLKYKVFFVCCPLVRENRFRKKLTLLIVVIPCLNYYLPDGESIVSGDKHCLGRDKKECNHQRTQNTQEAASARKVQIVNPPADSSLVFGFFTLLITQLDE